MRSGASTAHDFGLFGPMDVFVHLEAIIKIDIIIHGLTLLKPHSISFIVFRNCKT
jgi:hypothetical protein